MNRNAWPYDYRPIIVLAVFVLFAFALLAALLAPGAIPLLAVLPALIELLWLALKALGNG